MGLLQRLYNNLLTSIVSGYFWIIKPFTKDSCQDLQISESDPFSQTPSIETSKRLHKPQETVDNNFQNNQVSQRLDWFTSSINVLKRVFFDAAKYVRRPTRREKKYKSTMKEKLKLKDEQLEDMDELIQSLTFENTVLKKKLSTKDLQISDQQIEAYSKDELISIQELKINVQDKRISTQDFLIVGQKQLISFTLQEVSNQRLLISSKDEEIQDKERQMEAKRLLISYQDQLIKSKDLGPSFQDYLIEELEEQIKIKQSMAALGHRFGFDQTSSIDHSGGHSTNTKVEDSTDASKIYSSCDPSSSRSFDFDRFKESLAYKQRNPRESQDFFIKSRNKKVKVKKM